MYEYKATLRRVVDGDTVDFDVDLGFYMTAALRFRILGVDTPELRGGTSTTKAKAKISRAFVEEQLERATAIRIYTEKADSFGRWLARVEYTTMDGTMQIHKDLATELIMGGYGVERLK
jgi:micrococcal nuclease